MNEAEILAEGCISFVSALVVWISLTEAEMTCIGGLAAVALQFTALIANAEVLLEGRSNLLSAADHAQALRHMRVASSDPPKVSGPIEEEGRASNTASDELYLLDDELPLLTTDATDPRSGDELINSRSTEMDGKHVGEGDVCRINPGNCNAHARWRENLPKWREQLKNELRQGFASRPVREQWENQLRRVIETKDPCNADVLIFGVNQEKKGFFSRVDLMINELGLAMYFNQSVAICGGGPF